MRIESAVVDKVKEIDARYRCTWDTRAIAHLTGISHGSVAKILKESRGPRPEKIKPAHECRTKFNMCDVMWSSDFMDTENGRKLLKTMDEKSDYKLGWDVSVSDDTDILISHAQDIIRRTGRTPLAWKYDNGPCFKSKRFEQFLDQNNILPYPIRRRAPWTNGRTERDHREIQNWLMPVESRNLTDEEIKRDIDEGMFMLNFVKPRAVLGYKTSAAVYFKDGGVSNIDRKKLFEEVEKNKKNGYNHRKAVRIALQKMGLYEEWLDKKIETKSVNRSLNENVAI